MIELPQKFGSMELEPAKYAQSKPKNAQRPRESSILLTIGNSKVDFLAIVVLL